MSGTVRASIDGSVAHLIIDNPARRNAMSLDMYAAVPDAVRAIIESPAVRVVVLRGEGDVAFGAGSDISEFTEKRTGRGALHYNAVEERAVQAIEAIRVPVLALVHGPCMGGGAGMALCADIRFAADDATFAIPPAKLGVGYPATSTARLQAAVGASRAKDLIFSGRVIDANEALRIGMVDAVVAKDALDAHVAAEVQPGGQIIVERDAGRRRRRQRLAPPDALEGAFLAARPDGFYLFASWDFCCRGARLRRDHVHAPQHPRRRRRRRERPSGGPGNRSSDRDPCCRRRRRSCGCCFCSCSCCLRRKDSSTVSFFLPRRDGDRGPSGPGALLHGRAQQGLCRGHAGGPVGAAPGKGRGARRRGRGRGCEQDRRGAAAAEAAVLTRGGRERERAVFFSSFLSSFLCIFSSPFLEVFLFHFPSDRRWGPKSLKRNSRSNSRKDRSRFSSLVPPARALAEWIPERWAWTMVNRKRESEKETR